MRVYQGDRNSEQPPAENVIKAEQEQRALMVLAESCLHRRRACAAYYLNSRAKIPRIGFFLIIIILICSLSVLLKFAFKSARAPADSLVYSIPLSQPTQAHQFERFRFIHTVRKGDTLWNISVNYYGDEHSINRLREANDWIPADARKLDEGKTIIIPIN
jgi:hypothetical protein